MTAPTRPSRPAPPDLEGADRKLGRVHTLLLVALLALTAGRLMLNEPTFHRSPMGAAGACASIGVEQQMLTPYKVVRVASALLIGAIAGAWAVAGLAWGKGLTLRHPIFAIGAALTAGGLFASAAFAADRREALVTAAEQSSLLLAAATAMQLTGPAWRRRLVLIVLAAMAVTLGAKAAYQAGVEIPEQRAFFEQDRAARLAAEGMTADSPEATMLEARIVEVTTKGWFSLANIFGSLMVLLTLAAAGLAADKWLAWRADRRTENPKRPKNTSGDIPTPLVAAGLSTLLVVAPAAAWWLTGSTGAIGSGLAAAAAAVGLIVFRRRAARRRRALLIGAAAIGAVLIAAVVAVGLRRGGLPMRTLQVRWEYWTGSAAMTAARPLWGVGPGNFADAYLPHRPAGAEEAVKNPHNVIVQALTEYGLPAGAGYLLLLGWLLVAMTRRRRDDPADLAPPPTRRRAWLLIAAVGIGAVAWRTVVTSYPGPMVWLYDNFIPIVGVAGGLAAAGWTGRTPPAGPLADRTRVAEIALGCGVAGFALHNLSDFALFKPAAAMAFWVAGGALVGGARGKTLLLRRPAAAVVAAALVVAVVVGTFGLLGPVRRAERLVHRAAVLFADGRPSDAAAALAEAAKADPLDAAIPADRAGLLRQSAQRADDRTARARLAEALDAAELACRRNAQKPAYREMRANLIAYAARPDLLRFGWAPPTGDIDAAREAVEQRLARDPAHPVLLCVAGQLAYYAGDAETALRRFEKVADAPGAPRPILDDLIGDVYYRLGRPDPARRAWRRYRPTRTADPALSRSIAGAVESIAGMDPHDPYLRLRLATLAYHAGLDALAADQLAAARAANDALWPQSVLRFNARRLDEIQRLQTKLDAAETP